MEAKTLNSIRTEDVAEALWEMRTRLGVPNEILTDQGSQFVGDLAREDNSLLSITGIKTTPRHAQGNVYGYQTDTASNNTNKTTGSAGFALAK